MSKLILRAYFSIPLPLTILLRLCLLVVVAAFATDRTSVPTFAHEAKELDLLPRYEGPGYSRVAGAPESEFESSGVQLQAWLPLGEFDDVMGTTVTHGNDLWGYVSPSGGEYAIVGSEQGVSFVDVSTPTTPNIIAGFRGPSTLWRDVKTYKNYAYVVTDGGERDFEIYDLAQIDQGVVSHVNTVSSGATHNVAIDNESGFLYRSGNRGGDARGLMIYDLNVDPVNPPLVGQWTEHYFHDTQAVTYSDGPYAGRQIVFGFAGGNSSLDILDVTDKSNIQKLSGLNYSDGNFSHQGWLSPDHKYVYLDDEFDERNDPNITTTTTRIINVEDLENPIEVGTFTNGNKSIDHNLFVAYGKIFEANYRSGLRVFDASDPESPVEIAHFDTFPDSDAPQFNGLWANYPFFPSGTIIGSDFERGLFVWTVDGHDPTGDVNLDFQFDTRDVELLLTEIDQSAFNANFDLDGDGLVDHRDVHYLVRDKLGIELGDANLDDVVNRDDFKLLVESYGIAGGSNFTTGDFNEDGATGLADLILLQDNFGSGAAGVTAVPEPSSAALLLLAIATGGLAVHFLPDLSRSLRNLSG